MANAFAFEFLVWGFGVNIHSSRGIKNVIIRVARVIIVELSHPKMIDIDRVNTASGPTEVLVDEKEITNVGRVKSEVMSILTESSVVRVNYVEIVDRKTMEVEREIEPGRSLIVVAAWLNEVRLIDNLPL